MIIRFFMQKGIRGLPYFGIPMLAKAASDGARIVVLTDSDVTGRELRSRLVCEVPSAAHAFLGTHLSSAKRRTGNHRAGNVGVEHASAQDIREAIARARPAASEGGSKGARHELSRMSRDEFDGGDLEAWGLWSMPDPELRKKKKEERQRREREKAKWSAVGGFRERRRLVGEYLGVGECSAPELVRQLNLFFTREEAEAALAMLPGEGEAIPQKMTDGHADNPNGPGRRRRRTPSPGRPSPGSTRASSRTSSTSPRKPACGTR